MTHNEAVDLVSSLVRCVIAVERAEAWDRKYYNEEYEEVRDRLISALKTAQPNADQPTAKIWADEN